MSSDAYLAGFGCVVSFIAAGGFYVFIRQRYLAGPERIADPDAVPQQES